MITVYTTTYTGNDPRRRHITEHRIARQMLALGLSELYSLTFTEADLDKEIRSGLHGKPVLGTHPDIHFNISHCDGMIACAFSDTPVGIDVENIRSFPSNVLRKVLTSGEQALLDSYRNDASAQEELFFRFWTLKESRIKQSGTGMAVSLTDFSFEPVISEPFSSPGSSLPGLTFYQWKTADGLILSLCTPETGILPVIRSLRSDTFSL